MIRKLIFVLILSVFVSNALEAQAPPRVPRELPKLLSRAREFWIAMAASQRLKALEFVHPDKKEFLLSSGGMPFVNPEIVGIDFTDDENRAGVRVSVKLISPDALGNSLSWVVTDTWVWFRNNWFLDLRDSRAGVNNPFNNAGGAAPAIEDPAKVALRVEGESKVKILDLSVDVGKITRNGIRRIPVRMEYTGEVPIRVEPGLATDLLTLDVATSQVVSAQTKELVFMLNTEAWEGPFAIPLPLNIRYKGVVINRTVTVKGDVFAPLSLTQSPEIFQNSSGQDLQLTIRNNTQQTVSLLVVSVDSELFEVLNKPEKVPANDEVIVRIRLKPGATAQNGQLLSLTLTEPLMGRTTYEFALRVRPAP